MGGGWGNTKEENHMLSQCSVPWKRGRDTAQSADRRHGSMIF